MVSRSQRVGGWTEGVEQGVDSGLGGPAYAQPWGNADRAAVLGLSGTSPAWSANEVALWAFGEEDEVEGAAFGGGLLEQAKGARADGAGLAGMRDALQFEGQPEIVAWVDAVVPVGFGIALSEELGGAVVLGFGEEMEGSIVNEGGGWFGIEVSGALSGGIEGGEGFHTIGVGEEASAGVEGKVQVKRTFRVPWARLNDPAQLAAVAASAAVGGCVGDGVELAAPWLVQRLVRGHDLTPFLMSEELALEGEATLELSAGLLGEELALVAAGHSGVTASLEYEDLAENGVRKGTARLEGKIGELTQIAADLSAGGVDTTLTPIPHVDSSAALVLPFVETDGKKDFGKPWFEVAFEGGLGPADVKASAGLGPDHAGVSLEVAVDPGSVLWQHALDRVGQILELVTFGIFELETEATFTLKMGISLEHPALAEIASIAADVARWVATGEVSASLAPVMDVVDVLVRSASLELEADVTVAALHGHFEEDVLVVGEVGIEADAQAGMVYKRDNLLEDLETPPTIDEAIAMMRGSASLA